MIKISIPPCDTYNRVKCWTNKSHCFVSYTTIRSGTRGAKNLHQVGHLYIKERAVLPRIKDKNNGKSIDETQNPEERSTGPYTSPMVFKQKKRSHRAYVGTLEQQYRRQDCYQTAGFLKKKLWWEHRTLKHYSLRTGVVTTAISAKTSTESMVM